jgi:hypothetical protein
MFFQKEFRKRKDNDDIEIASYIPKVFKDIYITHSDKTTLHISDPFEHNMFKLLLTADSGSSAHTCDGIFIKYLDYIAKLSNKEYFLFAFKFVVLFRECLNRYKSIELENTVTVFGEKIELTGISEFTQFYDAEQAPELCNEFISEYLTANSYFGMSYEYVTEFIEIIQHFCYWLYENNYTSSRLSINSDI